MMDKIEHAHFDVNGLSLHVAHTGQGKLGTVLFLHGFPEIWYSWRHQMLAVAGAGFRAIAPDLRGYGLSGQPSIPEDSSWQDLVADLIAILDLLSISKVHVVAKDFGARPAYDLSLRHPDRVATVATLGVPFLATVTPFISLPEGFYMNRWREPGRAEADFGRFDVRRVVRTIYILFSRSEIPIAEEGQEILDLADSSAPLPPWFTEADLDAYAALYENSGFSFPLHMPYRSLHKLETGGEDPKVEVPAMLVMGEKDYVLKFPGMENYVKSGEVKHFVPDLEIVYVPEGCHFIQEQFPDQVNKLIVGFLKNHPSGNN
ncbi:epoxide hydrolase A-like isoform X2 [Zingiber officinale]|uniref:epoxide hydrolase A-like isoform X2 n=1 Tax=Zingiber officinale TaxID=94328 RepID=UPI001C4CA1B9|nr:epoxide hydrolase A-like isoform X2 [Zingiber officinale]